MNSTQTNYFENGSILHRAGTNFRVQAAKYNFQLGLGAQYSDLKSYSKRKRVNNTDTIVDISHSFLNFFPTANFNYTLAKSKNLRFSFRGRTTQPGILQLQDVPDYTNPLYVRTGNPALKEEFNSNFNLSYNSFNSTTFRYTNFNIQFDNTANKIANSIDTLGRGIQLVKPVNMNGAFRSSASVNFGLPRKGKMKGSSINFNSSVNLNRDLSMLNKQESRVNNMILTQSANINLDFKETLNMGLNASLSYNNASYSVQKNLNADYLSQTYSADINYTAFKNLVLSTDFDYYLSTGREEGYNQNIPLWNAGIARQLFKKKNGEIKFNVHDILNQNESITRSVGDNYITDSRTMVLQRYFMLTFTYNLNRAGAGNQMRNQGPGQFQRRGNS